MLFPQPARPGGVPLQGVRRGGRARRARPSRRGGRAERRERRRGCAPRRGLVPRAARLGGRKRRDGASPAGERARPVLRPALHPPAHGGRRPTRARFRRDHPGRGVPTGGVLHARGGAAARPRRPRAPARGRGGGTGAAPRGGGRRRRRRRRGRRRWRETIRDARRRETERRRAKRSPEGRRARRRRSIGDGAVVVDAVGTNRDACRHEGRVPNEHRTRERSTPLYYDYESSGTYLLVSFPSETSEIVV